VLLGLLSFYAVCSIGAVANVGIADFLFLKDYDWWVSGICGIPVGAVWNYATSALFTWRK
jgi:dolichol-phosphate mannosyltransferase